LILEQLSNAPGVSGQEDAVRKIILEAIRPHVDEWHVDTMGNVLALKKAAPGAPSFKVMLAAHMDEVGFMITGHDSSGGLRFKAVGGIDHRILPGKSVRVGPDQIPGVIGAKPIHLLEDEEETRVIKIDAMVIDIGAGSKEDAERLVKLGEFANFATRYRRMGRVATGKAFDDRAGCTLPLPSRKKLACAARARRPSPSSQTALLFWKAPFATTCPKTRMSALPPSWVKARPSA
jgi:putative aminopeptidase FrvX